MNNANIGARVFVRIEDYKNTLSLLDVLRDKVEDAKKTLDHIKELKNGEDSELESWNSTLDDIEKKLDIIDKTLFKPESNW